MASAVSKRVSPLDANKAFLLRQVLRLSNGKRFDVTALGYDFFDRTHIADLSEYPEPWLDTLRRFLAHWQSPQFCDDVWIAARTVHWMIKGAGKNHADGLDAPERSFSLFTRLIGQCLQKYRLHGSRVQAQLHVDSPTTTSNNASVNAHVCGSSSDEILIKCVFTYTPVIDAERDLLAGQWTRRAVELAVHEFRHFAVNLAIGLGREIEYSPHSDSPWEIDARLFQRLVVEIACDLSAVQELDGNTPFGPPIGPPIRSRGVHPQALPYFLAKGALSVALERERDETGFAFFHEGLHAVATHSAECVQRIREIDMELSSPSLLRNRVAMNAIERDLSTMRKSEVSECAEWGNEWTGYYLKRQSANTDRSGRDRKLAATLSTEIFRDLLLRSQNPRYYKYALQALTSAGMISRSQYMQAWSASSSYLFGRWSDYIGTTSVVGPVLKALFESRCDYYRKHIAAWRTGPESLTQEEVEDTVCSFPNRFTGARAQLAQLAAAHRWFQGAEANEYTSTVVGNLNIQLPFEDWLHAAAGYLFYTDELLCREQAIEVLAVGDVYATLASHIEVEIREGDGGDGEPTACASLLFVVAHEMTLCQDYVSQSADWGLTLAMFNQLNALIGR